MKDAQHNNDISFSNRKSFTNHSSSVIRSVSQMSNVKDSYSGFKKNRGVDKSGNFDSIMTGNSNNSIDMEAEDVQLKKNKF